MNKLDSFLLPIMTLLILTILSNLSASLGMAQTIGNETKEKTEETLQTEKPFFFSYLILNCLHLT